MMCSNQRAWFAQSNLYAIDVDQKNKNCYNCGEFRHLAKNYRNRGIRNKIGEGRRLEYGNNRQRLRTEGENGQNNNLNGDRNLIVLN